MCTHMHKRAQARAHLEEGEEAVEARPGRALVEELAARVQQGAHLRGGGLGFQAGGGSILHTYGIPHTVFPLLLPPLQPPPPS